VSTNLAVTADDLNGFVVRAKRATYVGNGLVSEPSRPGSHDLTYDEDRWSYRDSYFGGTDFLGQESVWHDEVPVWAMNYYGYILRPDLIDPTKAGLTIKAALSAMYSEDRFLGGFEWVGPYGRYVDQSTGDVTRFHGNESILVDDVRAYSLDYFGGLIKP
jgi:hypothetical protein